MKLYLPLAFAASVRHSFAAASLRGQEQKSSSVSSLTSSSSSLVGAGLCKDNLGRVYDRVTFSGVDTRDACESLCAPLGGDSNLVGYEYSDTLNICSCRFTEGYINTSQLGGVGNCPSGAYADWGGEACKVVPLTQGGSGVGKVTQADSDSRYDCFRNENFSICDGTYVEYGYRYGCPDNDEMVTELKRYERTLWPCQLWYNAQGVGCCSYGREWVQYTDSNFVDWRCTWRGYANAPVSLVYKDIWSQYARLVCD